MIVSFLSGINTSVILEISSDNNWAWSKFPCTKIVFFGFTVFTSWINSVWSACPDSSICSTSALTSIVFSLYLNILSSFACVSGLSGGRYPEVIITESFELDAHSPNRCRLAPACPNPDVQITIAGSLIWVVLKRWLTCLYLNCVGIIWCLFF